MTAAAAPTPAAEPLRMAGLCKRFGSVQALDQVDLDVAGGSFVTLLGPSGSGKTTLLMALAGLVPLDAGTIALGARRLDQAPPHRRGLGVVFQNYALFPHMNVRENIYYPLRTRGTQPVEAGPAIDRALDLVRLSGYGDRRIDQLSGGQRQRIALARALVFAPPVLLLDEPLSALDRNLREEMQIELRQIHHRLGTTMIMVTHDQEEALALSDRIAVMNGGRIVQHDAPQEIYRKPASRFVAGFVGRSHLLPVVVRDGRALWNGLAVSTRHPPRDDDAYLVVRPEHLRRAEGPAPDDATVFEGTITAISYRGDTEIAVVALAEGSELTLRSPAGGMRSDGVGAPIRVALRRQDAVLVPA